MKVSRVCQEVGLSEKEAAETPGNAVLYCHLQGSGKSSAGQLHGEGPEETAYFEVVKSSGDLVRVLVESPGGVAIEFRFANWQRDPPVDDSLFRFTVPKGVAIVNGELSDGQNSVNR